MPVYFLDAAGVERIKKTCGMVLDNPVRIQPDQQLPYYPHEQIHHAVYVTNGVSTNGRYRAKLQYRVERGTTDTKPVWVDFDPPVQCWAIGYEGEALEAGNRYHGFLVDEYTDAEDDGMPIYACVRGTSVQPIMVYDGVPNASGYYLGWLEYRDEDLQTFLSFDPIEYVWVIGYNGEALEGGKRYKGLFVSTDPVDKLAVYAVQPATGSVKPVFVTDGTPVSGRYAARIDRRDENTPEWLAVDPLQFVWAIGYNGESLTANTRYKGLLVSVNPADGVPVYAVQPGGGGSSSAGKLVLLSLEDEIPIVGPTPIVWSRAEWNSASTWDGASGLQFILRSWSTNIQISYQLYIRTTGAGPYYLSVSAATVSGRAVLQDFTFTPGLGGLTLLQGLAIHQMSGPDPYEIILQGDAGMTLLGSPSQCLTHMRATEYPASL